MSQAAPRLRILSDQLCRDSGTAGFDRLRANCLLTETGKTLVQHTYEAGRCSPRGPAGCAWPPITRKSRRAVRSFGGDRANDQPRLRPVHRSGGRDSPAVGRRRHPGQRAGDAAELSASSIDP